MERRFWLIALVACLAAAIAFPLGVIASHQFTDVPNTSTYHADIDAIRDAGITTGCAPNLYCPKDFVTREQMAAFLNRLGALQAGKPPVVNAAELDGLDSTAFLAVSDITIVQQGPWLDLLDVAITDRGSWTEISGIEADSQAGVALDSPGTIGSLTYGIKTVQYCVLPTSVNTTVDSAALYQSRTADPYQFVFSFDQTNRTTAGCYTLTDPSPHVPLGATHLRLVLSFGASAEIKLSNVTTTWTPVG